MRLVYRLFQILYFDLLSSCSYAEENDIQAKTIARNFINNLGYYNITFDDVKISPKQKNLFYYREKGLILKGTVNNRCKFSATVVGNQLHGFWISKMARPSPKEKSKVISEDKAMDICNNLLDLLGKNDYRLAKMYLTYENDWEFIFQRYHGPVPYGIKPPFSKEIWWGNSIIITLDGIGGDIFYYSCREWSGKLAGIEKIERFDARKIANTYVRDTFIKYVGDVVRICLSYDQKSIVYTNRGSAYFRGNSYAGNEMKMAWVIRYDVFFIKSSGIPYSYPLFVNVDCENGQIIGVFFLKEGPIDVYENLDNITESGGS